MKARSAEQQITLAVCADKLMEAKSSGAIIQLLSAVYMVLAVCADIF